jgi:hypothetical protein
LTGTDILPMDSLLGLNYYDDDEDEQQTEIDGNTAKPIKAISGKRVFIISCKHFKKLSY